MKKLLFLSVLFSAIVFRANAQQRELVVKNESKGLYLEHKVAPKEGLYAIGRLYNVHPKFIADYNKMDLYTGLVIGQVIQIPLSDTNFTQKSKNGVPVYYIPAQNEGLLKVSNANNKVAMQKLRDWNRLSGDNIAAGKKIIIGFLISKEMASVAVSNPVKEQPAKQQEKPVVKIEPEKEKEIKIVAAEGKPAEKTIPAEDKPVVKTEPVKETVQEVKKTDAVFAKEENVVSTGTEQGYFKKSFEQQVKASPASKNTTVTSGIFKTTSGWEDAKYYLLIDDVATGTIVKIINPENNKAVFAKVLGEMNGIRQNKGLNIRISNAASTALGVSDTEKFIVKLNY
ncbi:MAG TPA: LysM peptidoglycan-binding domain-containing protein [Chitinophagaceae bacterium]|nr:LysM peptidoglycan-binding domain-containing protein [Chitinophagaceae bacterium]